MQKTNNARFDLDVLIAEIREDEKVCRAAPRILSQEDIRRLIEDSYRRKQQMRLKTIHEN